MVRTDTPLVSPADFCDLCKFMTDHVYTFL